MKLKNLLKPIFAAVLLPAAFVASAADYDFEENGIYYHYFYTSIVKQDRSRCVVTSNGSDKYEGDIVIPETVNNGSTRVVTVGSDSFIECTELTSVVMANVQFVSDDAFFGCTSLESVNLGHGLETIGSCSFLNCHKISEIISLNPTPPSFESNSFDLEIYKNATVRVPVGCGDAYRADLYWRKFANIVETDFGGVDEVASDDVSVTVNGGSIEIAGEGNALVEVYNLSGQLVYSGMETTIGGIARGIYIVRVAGQTFKVAL